jgi:cellulose synthase/poly-beta-1,6-N-acetylglucosamine synthase-like glycosyltransferase
MNEVVAFTLAAAYGVCFLLPASLAAMYYSFLMLARVLGARALVGSGKHANHTFAIIIPAHNEEQIIPQVVQSCLALEYPAGRYRVIVVADNCSDGTAAVARCCGALCLERNDLDRRGKGQALEWAFAKVLPMGHDAVLVLDADCAIDRHALRVFDRSLAQGSRVLQANYVLSNPDASPISYVARVGNTLEYDFFYAPKSCLGLAVLLVGTGMVFHRDVLRECPWKCHSITEDAEYALILAAHGIRIRFVADAPVSQAGAERLEQLTVQRERWAGGTLQLGRSVALKLLVKGLLRGRLLLADAGWTVLVVGRPLVLVHLLLTLGFAFLLNVFYPGLVSRGFVVVGASLLGLYAVYFGVGILAIGVNARRISFLLRAPLVLSRLAIISLKSLLSHRKAWVRTPR